MNYAVKYSVTYCIKFGKGLRQFGRGHKNCNMMCSVCLTGAGYRDRRSLPRLIS
jgi:hypothetical protein